MFLNLLGSAAGVSKKRDRMKDPATCRVIKNANGTPLRSYYYTLEGNAVASTANSRPIRPETRKERNARISKEISERHQLAAQMPDRSWAEELCAIDRESRAA